MSHKNITKTNSILARTVLFYTSFRSKHSIAMQWFHFFNKNTHLLLGFLFEEIEPHKNFSNLKCYL